MITPEEVVRQAAILYLKSIGYSLNHISVERQIKVVAVYKRYDIVTWDKNGQPLILVECKAPSASLNQTSIDQAGIYNLALRGTYIWLTNGHDNRVFYVDAQKKQYQEIDSLPLKREM